MSVPSRFSVSATALAGLKLVERHRLEDERGFLSRFYCAKDLTAAGFNDPIVQINQTLTRKAGTVRGMHYQRQPHSEDKFVSCLRGEVFDVAVDLRAESPTFLQWHGEVLSGTNSRSLFIPKGFAHGFQTLADDCELIYLHTAAYSADADAAIHACEPRLAIEWPLPISDMSARDRSHPPLTPDYSGLTI